MTDQNQTTQNTDTTPGANTGQNPQPPNTGQSGQSSTQDANNPAWLPERLRRAEESAVNKLLKELGVEKPDELKALFADAKKIREAQMSDAEKAKAELDKATKRATDAEAKAADLEAARVKDRVDGALAKVATTARAEHPEDVIDHLRKNYAADLEPLHKDGADLGEKALQGLIDKVKKDRPGWFLTGGPGSPSNRSGRTPDPTDAAKKQIADKVRFKL